MTYYDVPAADVTVFLAQDDLDLTKVADPVKTSIVNGILI